jgi:hypothetical protein
MGREGIYGRVPLIMNTVHSNAVFKILRKTDTKVADKRSMKSLYFLTLVAVSLMLTTAPQNARASTTSECKEARIHIATAKADLVEADQGTVALNIAQYFNHADHEIHIAQALGDLRKCLSPSEYQQYEATLFHMLAIDANLSEPKASSETAMQIYLMSHKSVDAKAWSDIKRYSAIVHERYSANQEQNLCTGVWSQAAQATVMGQADSPPEANQQGLNGTVEILVQLDAQGKALQSKVLSGPEIFRSAALKSVETATFRPEIRKCKAVPSAYRYIVEFTNS